MTEYIYEHKPSGADHMGKPVELPTLVQREEIVRCRDCVFCSPERPTEINGVFEVRHPVLCHMHIIRTKPDGFCVWAVKRKEDGDDWRDR